MGADNWTKCPRCVRREILETAKRKQVADEAYGTVPVGDWKLLDEAANAPSALKDTLREDYEIGIYGNEFSVSYGAHCTVCNWSHSFKHEELSVVGQD